MGIENEVKSAFLLPHSETSGGNGRETQEKAHKCYLSSRRDNHHLAAHSH